MLEPRSTFAQYTEAMIKLEAAVLERDKAIKDRDEAIEERDFILKFLQEMGDELLKSRALNFKTTRQGVEIRSLYPSHADALAIAMRVRDLRMMVSVGYRTRPETAAAFATCMAQAAAQARA